MFSHHRRNRPQRGHAEPGLITDLPSGSRQIHTFKKLPTQAPAQKTKRGQSRNGGLGTLPPIPPGYQFMRHMPLTRSQRTAHLLKISTLISIQERTGPFLKPVFCGTPIAVLKRLVATLCSQGQPLFLSHPDLIRDDTKLPNCHQDHPLQYPYRTRRMRS
jgi:hypothetical protein